MADGGWKEGGRRWPGPLVGDREKEDQRHLRAVNRRGGWCSRPWATKSEIQPFYSYVVLNSPRRTPTPYPGQGIHRYTSPVSLVVLNTARNTKQTIWGWHGDPWGATREPRGPPDRPRGTLKSTLYGDRTELEGHHRLIGKV